MVKTLISTLSALSLVLMLGCTQESPSETAHDVSKAQQNGAEEVAEARQDAAKDVNEERKDVSEAATEGAHDVALERAEAAHKVAIEKCEAMTGDARDQFNRRTRFEASTKSPFLIND